MKAYFYSHLIPYYIQQSIFLFTLKTTVYLIIWYSYVAHFDTDCVHIALEKPVTHTSFASFLEKQEKDVSDVHLFGC